ncbi:MAG TPA: class I SAM-dependent methyltransferase [Terriglobia bacterium]|nr:class I SAM-dependent methyltransferase [Terriglobia bacterium]
MPYGRDDYLKDLKDSSMPHIRSRERFRDFYDELGRDPVQKAQTCQPERLGFVEPRGRIIELGCHVGFNLVHYARQGFQIDGVDLSEVLLREAEKLIAKEPAEVASRIKLIHAFIEDLPPDPKYDTVLLLETLEHVIDPLPIVLKATELLAPDGTIFISAPSTRVGTYSHVRGVSVDEAIRMCHQANLSIETAYSETWRDAYRNIYVVARHRS